MSGWCDISVVIFSQASMSLKWFFVFCEKAYSSNFTLCNHLCILHLSAVLQLEKTKDDYPVL